MALLPLLISCVLLSSFFVPTQGRPWKAQYQQVLPDIPGYVPVYIQDGDTPPDVEAMYKRAAFIKGDPVIAPGRSSEREREKDEEPPHSPEADKNVPDTRFEPSNEDNDTPSIPQLIAELPKIMCPPITKGDPDTPPGPCERVPEEDKEPPHSTEADGNGLVTRVDSSNEDNDTPSTPQLIEERPKIICPPVTKGDPNTLPGPCELVPEEDK